jgi:[ribosomal protein S5]-alanine N-acetyltransferase
MPPIPTLSTQRLILRPFTLEDAPTVQELAGAWEIAEMTASIPHPYEDGMAEAWIGTHQDAFQRGETINFAVTTRTGGVLVGAISLMGINSSQHQAEAGYWIGKPYWNKGYCTEALQELIHYAFTKLDLNRVQARHMTRNPASGRVMQKAGMQFEGILRQSIYRWGKFEDAAMYSILKGETHAV